MSAETKHYHVSNMRNGGKKTTLLPALPLFDGNLKLLSSSQHDQKIDSDVSRWSSPHALWISMKSKCCSGASNNQTLIIISIYVELCFLQIYLTSLYFQCRKFETLLFHCWNVTGVKKEGVASLSFPINDFAICCVSVSRLEQNRLKQKQ